MSKQLSQVERKILGALDEALRSPGAQKAIQAIVSRVVQKLADDTGAALVWESVPLAAYGGRLPEIIRSSWVFVLRKNSTSGAERHPNSRQRMISYRGRADMQTWENGAWRSNVLTADLSAPFNQRWLSIPLNVWHKPVMGAEDWVVVSFHTATDTELIEERGDPQGRGESKQETYGSRSDSQFLGAR